MRVLSDRFVAVSDLADVNDRALSRQCAVINVFSGRKRFSVPKSPHICRLDTEKREKSGKVKLVGKGETRRER